MKRLLALLTLLIVLTACTTTGVLVPEGESPGGDLTLARVTEIVDGDTIKVKRLAGAVLPSRNVRLLSVDCPETPNEAYSKAATDYTRKAVLGEVVYLERDVSEVGPYNRALRYVWVGDRPSGSPDFMLNAELVARGLAEVGIYPPDRKYEDSLKKIEKIARDQGRGIWG